MDNSRALFPTLNYAMSAFEACEGADAVLVLTEWSEFRAIDPAALRMVVRSAAVIDGRNCLDATAWCAAGWSYRALGRPALGSTELRNTRSGASKLPVSILPDRRNEDQSALSAM
jgi:UDPglucose 6-dehydrogenase